MTDDEFTDVVIDATTAAEEAWTSAGGRELTAEEWNELGDLISAFLRPKK